MSITFYLQNHNTLVDIPNPHFNPYEPEDPIYNPRLYSEPMYPEINVSNSNAIRILIELGIQNPDGPFNYSGQILNKNLDDICKLISAKLYGLKDERLPPDEVYLLNQLPRFDRLFRFAIGLDDNIIWA